MIVRAHLIPAAGVRKCADDYARPNRGGLAAGDGVAHAVLTTAELVGQDADVVVLAVPAGRGARLISRLLLRRAPLEEVQL